MVYNSPLQELQSKRTTKNETTTFDHQEVLGEEVSYDKVEKIRIFMKAYQNIYSES